MNSKPETTKLKLSKGDLLHFVTHQINRAGPSINRDPSQEPADTSKIPQTRADAMDDESFNEMLKSAFKEASRGSSDD